MWEVKELPQATRGLAHCQDCKFWCRNEWQEVAASRLWHVRVSYFAGLYGSCLKGGLAASDEVACEKFRCRKRVKSGK